MKFKGSCHCGKVAFEVEGDLTGALACNCSICSRKATLLWFVPRDAMKLLTPEDALTTYTFNKHVIRHRFCKTCGVQAFGEAPDPSGKKVAAINIRCLENIDVAAVPVQHYDGRSL